MLYATPALTARELAVVAEIDELRSRLSYQVATPRRWIGSLRRLSFARAVQASNSIEGYNATLDDVAAVVAGEEPLDPDVETTRALQGYRDAMTYVLQLAEDPHYRFDETLLRSLHFMMLGYDLSKNPGRWRPGAIFVRNDESGEIVYDGPDAGIVPELIHELVDRVAVEDADQPAIVRAAMAHLNLVLVHPFSDGNGRMARCVQTLVLAREAILEPPFASIEEYLGRNTTSYYSVLAEVAQGHWTPAGDARPWVRFCLTAHVRQARTLLRRARHHELLWERCAVEVAAARLPERAIAVVFNAALGFRERNATYRAASEDDITDATASRDLRALVAAGVLVANGEKRGRFYTAGPRLREIATEVRAKRPLRDDTDPFA